jgi:hypothetical protein
MAFIFYLKMEVNMKNLFGGIMALVILVTTYTLVTAQKADSDQKEKKSKEQLVAEEKERAKKRTKAEAERKEMSKPLTEKLKELATKKEGDALIILPWTLQTDDQEKTRINKAISESRLAQTAKPQYPTPSKTFEAEVCQNMPGLNVRQAISLHNGGTAVAAREGGYLVDKDGKVKVVGNGKDCTAVAVSPTKDVAFAFVFTKERVLTSYFAKGEPKTTNDPGPVIEIHVVGSKPQTILLGQYWRTCNAGVRSLSYSADGKTLAIFSYSEWLVLVTEEKAWQHLDHNLYTARLGLGLGFHPTSSSEILCSGYHIALQEKNTCKRTWIGNDGYFGPEGQIVSVLNDLEDVWFEFHDGNKTAPLQEGRYLGPDRMAVGKNYIAYTMLDKVLIWDRQAQKDVQKFRNVPDTELTWMPGYVEFLAFRENNLLVVSTNGEVAEWDAKNGKKLKVIVKARPSTPAAK